ncbi:galactose mutarotase-like domain-containing protein [Artemisia annua]|uniref:Galactose mutarotase-like domain-containing protein n=1 Tax=Artemisia annua TaxID=35608 RepID=A0A2U1PH18_ARTAN|nr:galactose mutarotase-like domain-containing protein [Artemisia annua]
MYKEEGGNAKMESNYSSENAPKSIKGTRVTSGAHENNVFCSKPKHHLKRPIEHTISAPAVVIVYYCSMVKWQKAEAAQLQKVAAAQTTFITQVQGKYYLNIHPVGEGSKLRRSYGQEIYSPLLLAFIEQICSINSCHPWIKNCFLFCFKGSSSYFDKQSSYILLESQQNPVDFFKQNPVELMNRSSHDGSTIRKQKNVTKYQIRNLKLPNDHHIFVLQTDPWIDGALTMPILLPDHVDHVSNKNHNFFTISPASVAINHSLLLYFI